MAAGLEATNDAAEVFVHLFLDKKDTVKVVGHHLEGDDFHLWVVARNAPPFIMHSLPKGREFHSWRIGAAERSITMTAKLTEEGKAPLGSHGHHVDHSIRVIMIHGTAKHGGLLLASKGFLLFVGFSIHQHKGTSFPENKQVYSLFLSKFFIIH